LGSLLLHPGQDVGVVFRVKAAAAWQAELHADALQVSLA